MKRYDHRYANLGPVAEESGDWVRYEDAMAAIAAEREQCARLCEHEARLWERDGRGPATEARLCAARIRARN